jgi:hypothetical protein
MEKSLLLEKKSNSFRSTRLFVSPVNRIRRIISQIYPGLVTHTKKLPSLVIIFLLLPATVVLGANKYSVANGGWNSTSTWSTTSGGTAGAAVPKAGDAVIIEGGYTVTLNANTKMLSSLTISQGATLVTASSYKVTSTTIIVDGTYTNGSTGTITGSLTVNGTYNHTTAIDNFPSANWADTSNCNITGFTTALNVSSFSGQTYGNVTYNCTGQTGAIDLLAATSVTIIAGNFTVQSTGSNTLYLRMSGQVYDPVLTIYGDFIITGGTVDGNNSGTTNGSVIVNIGGNYTQTGGTFVTSTTQTGSSCDIHFTGATSMFNLSGGTFNTGSSRFPIIIDSAATLTLSSNLTLINGYGLTVSSGGTLDVPNGVTLNTTSGTFTNDGTVNSSGTITNYVQAGTYTNLTISGSGVWSTTGVTVNGTLSMEGTATISVAITFGPNATLQYNTSTDRTTDIEWPSNFSGSGGIIIANTGAITMNSAEVVNTSITINSGATLKTGNYNLTISGNLINNGTFNPGTATINYSNTSGGQTVAAATYTNLTLGNTSGTQTAAGDIVVNGTFTTTSGGTFNLGTNALSGTLSAISNGGVLETQNASTAIPTGKTWDGTVQYDGAAQTVSTGTYTNLTLGGNNTKTITTASTTVNGILSMEGTAAVSAVPTYGTSATLQYNKSTTFTAGSEWKASFSSSGGIIIKNTGTISLGSNQTVNAPISINTGASFNLGTNVISGTGSFTLNAGGELQVGHASGISLSGATGGIQVSGTRTFPATANYTYNGPSTQVFGNGLPSTVNNLTINNGSPGMMLSGSQTVSGTLILTSGKLAIGSYTLTLNGNFSGSTSNNLTTNGSSSNLTIGGSGTMGLVYFDQTTPGTTNRLQNLTINRTSQTITLGNTLQVNGTVTPTSGTLASAGKLVLISNASGTARVAAIGSSADISGNVTVQRYVPAETRRYRMLSSPTSGFTYSQLIDNIFFTGPGGTSNGFDYSPSNSYTAYTLQESTSGTGRGWKGVGNITNSANPGTGLYVFIRGDRTLSSPAWYTPPYVSQNAVTLDYSGTLNKGTISPTITYTNTGVSTDDGWNLVGNPYASPIDWNSVSKSNISAFYYIYNPSTGSYVSDNGTTPIASGQAFYVQATGASPSISFSESSKTASTATEYFKGNNPKLTIQMIKDSVNSDVAWIEFASSASAGYDPSEDALKYYNSTINFGALLNNDSVEVQYSTTSPLSSTADTFPLFVYVSSGSYSLSFNGLNSIASGKQIFL